jgi:hypothetical protein
MTKLWFRVALTGALCFGLGFGVAWHIAPRPTLSPPIPAPAPAVKPQPRGHFTVSYIDQVHSKPASAAVRDSLAAADWAGLDATFRAYTHGQDELTALGFATLYVAADLPTVFIQETRPDGRAPIIDQIRAPASAELVLTHVTALRGTTR